MTIEEHSGAKKEGLPPGGMVEVARGVMMPEGDLRIQFSRSSGPGGQNVNKVNTRVELWVPLSSLYGLDEGALDRLRTLAGGRLTASGEIHLASDAHRSQAKNRREVMQRLRELLTEARHKPLVRRATRPSSSARRRRLESKRRRSQIKSARRENAEE